VFLQTVKLLKCLIYSHLAVYLPTVIWCFTTHVSDIIRLIYDKDANNLL